MTNKATTKQLLARLKELRNDMVDCTKKVSYAKKLENKKELLDIKNALALRERFEEFLLNN